MNQQKGIKRFFADFKKFFPLLLNLAGKDFKLKYRRSILGVLWSILNPLLTMIIITRVFGILLKVQVENFATYYLLGYTLWTFFSESTTNSMSSIVSGAPLIKKVYIPKYVFPVEKCLFSLINFGFSLIAVLLVMLLQGVYPTPVSLLVFLPVLYCFLFCVGFSLILSALTVYFRDIMHLYSVLLTIWMYLTPIIYPMSILKDHDKAIAIVHCNPMYYFVEYFRAVMMHGSDPIAYPVPSFAFNMVCLAIGLGTLVLGGLVFSRAQKRFILHI